MIMNEECMRLLYLYDEFYGRLPRLLVPSDLGRMQWRNSYYVCNMLCCIAKVKVYCLLQDTHGVGMFTRNAKYTAHMCVTHASSLQEGPAKSSLRPCIPSVGFLGCAIKSPLDINSQCHVVVEC